MKGKSAIAYAKNSWQKPRPCPAIARQRVCSLLGNVTRVGVLDRTLISSDHPGDGKMNRNALGRKRKKLRKLRASEKARKVVARRVLRQKVNHIAPAEE